MTDREQAIAEAGQHIAQALMLLIEASTPSVPAPQPELRQGAAVRPLNYRYWFNTAQAAEYTGMDAQTITHACRSGALKAGQPSGFSGRWRIHRDDLDAWLRGDA